MLTPPAFECYLDRVFGQGGRDRESAARWSAQGTEAYQGVLVFKEKYVEWFLSLRTRDINTKLEAMRTHMMEIERAKKAGAKPKTMPNDFSVHQTRLKACSGLSSATCATSPFRKGQKAIQFRFSCLSLCKCLSENGSIGPDKPFYAAHSSKFAQRDPPRVKVVLRFRCR